MEVPSLDIGEHVDHRGGVVGHGGGETLVTLIAKVLGQAQLGGLAH